MDTFADIRQKTPKPSDHTGAAALPAKSAIDGAKLDATFGVKGQSKDGMYKATMGRAATASCGCAIGKTMGVNTWGRGKAADLATVLKKALDLTAWDGHTQST